MKRKYTWLQNEREALAMLHAPRVAGRRKFSAVLAHARGQSTIGRKFRNSSCRRWSRWTVTRILAKRN